MTDAKRNEWEFEYTARALAEAARQRREFRLGRASWWKEAKEKVMTEIKESGIEVSESVAAHLSNYASKSLREPQVMIRADLQDRIAECHQKIQAHESAAEEYGAWAQLLDEHSETRLRLTLPDWQYFFGTAG